MSSELKYSFNPGRPDLTFMVEFSGDVSAVEDVYVVTENRDGSTTTIPTVFDSESGYFVGSAKYTSNTIPAKIPDALL